ncbi:ribonucleoprotein PTB-binding 2 isoform X2 [Xenopus laevis]|uniref:Ribonucleoprotein PTB-binding 2 isoform X2 n=1 Tax=Xenopus laevis TaxID=8355 RepID=A0A8J0V5X9_XENLA|nr:ribonucleoprotein PTB-binding 2 isoform X2 [Xenopus laevis]
MAARDSGLPQMSPGQEEDSNPEAISTASQDSQEYELKQPACSEGAAATLPALDETEKGRRLETSLWELRNRRKILMKNLPHDCTGQDIHDLLKGYEIKYCYVDKNKKTAFVTLLNGEQAQNVIQKFHQHTLRDREISVQLQPTDAVLCVTNLPPLFTLHNFEDLVRAYGNTERCLLVYSELTGHSKGYGFVEYMKKDSASNARLELFGKPLAEFTLFAQWMDSNHMTMELIHSKCLCVNKLPKGYNDCDELTQLFSALYKPLFCQLAEDEGGCFVDFAVVEYETAEQAEAVRNSMDGTTVKGSRIQLSFCAPGSPGRSTLAALVAAQGMLQNNRKGLLPEPNTVQIMQSFSNPAMLQMLLQPQQRGRSGKHGSSSGQPHFVNPTVSHAFLQLNKLHQTQGMGGNSLLQNYSHLQMAQKQLLQLKSAQSNNCKPGLLGEAPVSVLQTSMGSSQPGSVEALQQDVHKSISPFYHSQHMSSVLSRLTQEKQSTSIALLEGSGCQTYLQQSESVPAGQNQPQSQSASTESPLLNKSINQTSLLGEPPRDIRLSTNPYLNLASVLAGSSIAGTGIWNIQQQNMNSLTFQESASQPGLENYLRYSQQYGDYSQSSPGLAYGNYNTYVQAPPTYYSNAQMTYQAESTVPSNNASTKEKRTSILSATEASPAGYVNQVSEGSGEHNGDSYFKRKKVY